MSINTSTIASTTEVPLFLRKTYHMIDTCDPTIASWSDDGETFVVRDPNLFEQTIIPQFFKHSKFSSFVRQLNFYSFRKIKYSDNLKIDPKLEEETANFWRFRHDSFRRGRPDLLTEIKRTNGQKGSTTLSSKEWTNDALSSDVEKPNLEVQTLKEKIEEMTKNIDQLTEIVKKVSLKQEEQDRIKDDEVRIAPELKRKKVESCLYTKADPDHVMSNSGNMNNLSILADKSKPPEDGLCAMAMDFDDIVLSSVAIPTDEFSPLLSRETSNSTEVTDNEFVEQLFTAFDTCDDEDVCSISLPVDSTLMPKDSPLLPQTIHTSKQSVNRPDPELMRRVGDALMLLPREIQEMIVDKLVASITELESVAKHSIETTPVRNPVKVSLPIFNKVENSSESEIQQQSQQQHAFTTARFAALLHYYTQHAKDKCCKNVPKAIPVIPVHA